MQINPTYFTQHSGPEGRRHLAWKSSDCLSEIDQNDRAGPGTSSNSRAFPPRPFADLEKRALHTRTDVSLLPWLTFSRTRRAVQRSFRSDQRGPASV